MVLTCKWQAEIHSCGPQCPQASLRHCHVSIGAAEWPQRSVFELEGQNRGFSLQCLRSDMEFCMDLAREAPDWLLFLLKVGEITCAFASFRIVERVALDRRTFKGAAQEMKQIQRAA